MRTRIAPLGRRQVRLHPAFWLSCFFVMVTTGRITETIPSLSDLNLADFTAGLALLLVFFGPRDELRSCFQNKLLSRVLLFLGIIFLGVFVSIYTMNTVEFLSKKAITLLVLIFLVAVTARTLDAIQKYIGALIISASLFAVIAIYSGDWSERVAVESMFDQNDLALMLVSILPLAIARSSLASTRARRVLFLSLSFCMLFTIVLTQSRGGIVALAVLSGYLVIFPGFSIAAHRGGGSEKIRRIAVLGMVGLILFAASPENAKQRIYGLMNLSGDYNMQLEKPESRLAIWNRNLKWLAKNPWGAGAPNSQEVDMRMGGQYRTAHNSFVQVAVETGIIGVFLFINLFRKSFRELGSAAARISALPANEISASMISSFAYCHALRAALVTFAAGGFFLSQGYSSLLFTLFMLSGAVILVIDNLLDNQAK